MAIGCSNMEVIDDLEKSSQWTTLLGRSAVKRSTEMQW